MATGPAVAVARNDAAAAGRVLARRRPIASARIAGDCPTGAARPCRAACRLARLTASPPRRPPVRPPADVVETALIVVGLVVLSVLMAHALAGDDNIRYDDIDQLLRHGHLTRSQYS